MLRSQLRSALRAPLRDKRLHFLNLLGFSAGMAAFMIVSVYLKNQLDYDQHFANHENIYRVATERDYLGNALYTALSPPQIGPLMVSDTPQLLSYVRFQRHAVLRLFRDQIDAADWRNIYAADANVFDVFAHTILFGDPSTALLEPGTIAISKSMASRYFGDENPIGKILSEEGQDYRVTLVFADLPSNTHLKYEALVPLVEAGPMLAEGFRRQIVMLLGDLFYTYIQTAPEFDIDSVDEISERYVGQHMQQIVNESGAVLSHRFEPLAKIHFNSETVRDLPRGNYASLYILLTLALVIALVSCLNYSSMAQARTLHRAKEISIRKLLGAQTRSLIFYSVVGSISSVIAGICLALFFTAILLASAAPIMPVSAGDFLASLRTAEIGATLAILVLAACLITGASALMQLFRVPVTGALKKGTALSNGLSRAGLARRLILITQFTLCVLTINLSVMVFLQLRFVESNVIGFNAQNKLAVPIRGKDDVLRADQFISELKRLPSVTGATLTNRLPGQPLGVSQPSVRVGEEGRRQLSISHIVVDENFIDVMGIRLLSGRNLDSTDPSEVGRTNLVNNTLVNHVGWNNPIGESVGTWQVIGVVEDFNYGSLHQAIEPTVMRLDNENLERSEGVSASRIRRELIIAISPTNPADTLEAIAEIWGEFFPSQTFDYVFLEDHLSQLYDSEQRFLNSIWALTFLCISLSLIGILLISAIESAFDNRNRGIRVILGASLTDMILLRFRRQIPILLLSGLLGSMLSGWLVGIWIRDFHSQVSLGLAPFLIGPLTLTGLVLVAAIFQECKAARSVPAALISDS